MALPADVQIEIIPLEELSMGELDMLEEVGGPTVIDDLSSGRLRPKALLALAYVILRRSYPDVTLDEVRKLKVTVFRPRQRNQPNPTEAGA